MTRVSKVKAADLHRAARLARALANLDVLARTLARKKADEEMVLEIAAGVLQSSGRNDEYAQSPESICVDALTGVMILNRVADVLTIELKKMGIDV